MSKEADFLSLEERHCIDAWNEVVFPSHTPDAVIDPDLIIQTLRKSQPVILARLDQTQTDEKTREWLRSWHGKFFRVTLGSILRHPELRGTENKVLERIWNLYYDQAELVFDKKQDIHAPGWIYDQIIHPNNSDSGIAMFARIINGCAPTLAGFMKEFAYRMEDRPDNAISIVRGVSDALIPVYFHRAVNVRQK